MAPAAHALARAAALTGDTAAPGCYQFRPVPHGSARRAVSNKYITASVEEKKSSNKSSTIVYSPGTINSDDDRTGQPVAPVYISKC